MIDKYLRATDEAAAIAALPWARGVDENGQGFWLTEGPGFALCAVGTLYRPTGSLNDDGTPIMEAVPGFHINLRLTDRTLTEAEVDATGLVIAPASPSVVWAG